jgi:hypothetical protein
MADYCSKCGKKLGIRSTKYKSRYGSVLCLFCLKENKMKRDALKRQEELKQKEKKQEIMNDITSKYLVNKDTGIPQSILRICCEAYWSVSFLNFLEVDMQRTSVYAPCVNDLDLAGLEAMERTIPETEKETG